MAIVDGSKVQRRLARRRVRTGSPQRSALLAAALSAVLAVMVAAPAHGEEPKLDLRDKPAPTAVTIVSGNSKLTVPPPPFPGLVADSRTNEWMRLWWYGYLGETELEVYLLTYPKEEYHVFAPDDAAQKALLRFRDKDYGGHPRFRFQQRQVIEGNYGNAQYGVLCRGATPHAGEAKGELITFSGLLEKEGYLLAIECKPALSNDARKQVIGWIKTAMKHEGPKRDPKWTKDEAVARWHASTKDPKVRKKMRRILRTDHFIVLTNSSAGKLYAKKMELCYKAIKNAFPFEEERCRRLMPVLLFRTAEQYYKFCIDIAGYTREEAEQTGGHAYKDYYATYYASPNDPVHMHEATHQIFRNRLYLDGGGSWFQEGIAEYMCTSDTERKTFARGGARRGEFIPFKEFFRTESLVGSQSAYADKAYIQAASIMEFLIEDRKARKHFPEFVRRIGLTAWSDHESVEQTIRDLYGYDLAAFEAAWVAYWKKR